MKRLKTIVLGILVGIVANAQTPQVLGKSHAIQRVEVADHFLLLPVQERERKTRPSACCRVDARCSR